MPNLKTIAQLKNVENTEIIIANDDPIFAPIYKDALARQNMFITGSAGTGKSVITYNLISKLRAQGYKVGVGASTGVAGLILNASTIHKLL
ncbi:hypothetical protein FACS1894166_08330 [Bacilli bacterium]|nr:hypothetical protein FACS1894166_08330 [Bacilli bacterium]